MPVKDHIEHSVQHSLPGGCDQRLRHFSAQSPYHNDTRALDAYNCEGKGKAASGKDKSLAMTYEEPLNNPTWQHCKAFGEDQRKLWNGRRAYP
jgi:hypothetical protein